jgi:hypothetical protein
MSELSWERDDNQKPYWCSVLSTETFEGFDTLEEADRYAREYGEDSGPRYVFKLEASYFPPENENK